MAQGKNILSAAAIRDISETSTRTDHADYELTEGDKKTAIDVLGIFEPITNDIMDKEQE